MDQGQNLYKKTKVKESAKKNPPTKRMVRHFLQDIVVIDPEDQEFPLPADQLPDLPPRDLEQGPNNNNNPQLNPPNQPLDFPTGEVEQPNLPQNQQQDFTAEEQNQQNPPAEWLNHTGPPESTSKPSCRATKSA